MTKKSSVRSQVESLENRRLLSAALSSLSLVRAPSGVQIESLSGSVTIDLATAGKISVEATSSNSLGSVVFQLDGKTVQVESVAPYDIAGDSSSGFTAWTAPIGQHLLTATPFSAAKGAGTAGTPISVALDIVNSTSSTHSGPQPVAPPAGSSKLSGTLIGTSGSYQNKGNTIANAMDGNAATFFDAPAGVVGWVGLDLGVPMSITQVQFVPRSGFSGRMTGGLFQGSSSADFSTGVTTLATISKTPTGSVYTAMLVSNFTQFRYVRYLAPANGSGNVAELEFDGTANIIQPSFPTITNWTNGTPSPIVRAEAVGNLVGNDLYVFGGFDNEGSDDTSIPLQSRCDVYNIPTNTWHRLTDFPEPFTHSEGVVVGTDIWFVGGYIGNHPGPGTTHVWVYHTINDTWTRGPDLPEARGAGAAAIVGNTIYFTGGMDQTRTVDEATTWALDLNNQSAGWVQKANLPNARNHVAAASLNGDLYVIGGQHGQEDGQAAQSEVDRYDPTTNTWTVMASLPGYSGKSHITAGTFVYDGRIIVVGGETGYNDPQRAIVDYNPATNTWSEMGLLPQARSTTLAGIVNGKLIVTTGNSPFATNTTFIGSLSS